MICKLVNLSGQGLQVRTQAPSGSPPPPWTPAQLPGLLAYYDGGIVLPSNSVFTDTACTAQATAGQAIAGCKSLFGTSNNATQATALLQPTAAVGGFKVDAAGVKYLQTTTNIVLDSGVGFTIYCAMNVVSGYDISPLGCLTNVGGIVTQGPGASVLLIDDNFDTCQVYCNAQYAGAILSRFDCDSSGNVTGDATNSDTQTGGFSGLTTLNLLGANNAGIGQSDSADNQHMLYMISNQRIVKGSADDLAARAWILSKTGAIL